MYMDVLPVCAPCIWLVSVKARRGCQDPLELEELEIVVSRHIGTGTQTWIFWKSSLCS